MYGVERPFFISQVFPSFTKKSLSISAEKKFKTPTLAVASKIIFVSLLFSLFQWKTYLLLCLHMFLSHLILQQDIKEKIEQKY